MLFEDASVFTRKAKIAIIAGNPSPGSPLGYGDLAERFKFAVPHRGAGRVLNPDGLLANVAELPDRAKLWAAAHSAGL